MGSLLVNFFLYFLTLLYFCSKDRRMSLRVLIMVYFSVSAFASYYCMHFEMLAEYTIYRYKENSITPFFINYICILSLTTLLSDFRTNNLINNKIQSIVKNNTVRNLELVIIIVNTIYIIMMYLYSQILLDIGFKEVYDMTHEDRVVFTFSNSILNVLFYRSKDIIQFVYPFFLLFQFAKLSFGIEKKKTLILIFAFILPELTRNMLLSNRGGIVFMLMNFMFFISLFWGKFDKYVRKTFIRIGVVILSLSIFYFYMISLSRSEDDVDRAIDNYIIGYFGQTYCNLGWKVWDVNGNFIGGERKFPELFKLLGLYKAPNENGLLDINYYYQNTSGFPIILFKSFWGDLYCEFGLYLSLLFVLAYRYLIVFMKNVLKDSFLLLVIFYMHFSLLTFGLFDAKLDETFLMRLIIVFITCYFFSNISTKNGKTA